MMTQNGQNQSEPRTNKGNLPMVIGEQGARPSLARYHVPASFVSQLIAEKQHLATQRTRHRETNGTAIGAYAQGAKNTVRRMPAGYRLTASI